MSGLGKLLWLDDTNSSAAQALQELLAAFQTLMIDHAGHDAFGLA